MLKTKTVVGEGVLRDAKRGCEKKNKKHNPANKSTLSTIYFYWLCECVLN